MTRNVGCFARTARQKNSAAHRAFRREAARLRDASYTRRLIRSATPVRALSAVHGLGRLQARQVGNAIHRRMQRGKQRQPVGLERRIIGIDHHIGKERIDRRTQSRKRLQ